MNTQCERCNGHRVVVIYRWEPEAERIEKPCPRCRHEDAAAALDDDDEASR